MKCPLIMVYFIMIYFIYFRLYFNNDHQGYGVLIPPSIHFKVRVFETVFWNGMRMSLFRLKVSTTRHCWFWFRFWLHIVSQTQTHFCNLKLMIIFISKISAIVFLSSPATQFVIYEVAVRGQSVFVFPVLSANL